MERADPWKGGRAAPAAAAPRPPTAAPGASPRGSLSAACCSRWSNWADVDCTTRHDFAALRRGLPRARAAAAAHSWPAATTAPARDRLSRQSHHGRSLDPSPR
eukprot:4505915-Pyramimonas_sp.AAC.1